MSTATLEQVVAKRNDQTTKINADVLANCRIAATLVGKNLSDYISDIVGPVAEADIDSFAADRVKQAGTPKRKPKS